jgi:RNA polymerase sigma-70 factor (ECF subfamily)
MEADPLANLIERAQARDPGAFDALVEQYSSRLYGYLYRLVGSRTEAEDLLQEVFVRLVKTIGKYRHDGRFDGWLFRIATNLVRDRVRRSRSRPAGGDAEVLRDLAADGPASDPAARVRLAEERDRLQWALEQLSPAEREVVMLRHFTELSFKEIAEMMGTPVGTALARAHRGLAHLRELMTDESKGTGAVDVAPAPAPG